MAEKGLIGIQLSTIRGTIEKNGIYDTMKKCRELGYRCIEISQIPLTAENLAEFKWARKDFGIKVAAINAATTAMRPGMPCLENDYERILNDCRELDCGMLRMAMGPIGLMATEDGLKKFCEETDRFVTKLKQDGIEYYYHNHCMEFQKINGKYVLDYMRDNTGMGFELDIHWIWAGGQDPIRTINRYAGRIRLLHLKDYRIVVNPEEFMNLMRNMPAGAKPVAPLYASIQFAEVGEGSLDIKGCVDAGLAGGTEYFLVEQDSTYGRDPLESLRISRDNLIKLGYSDWF